MGASITITQEMRERWRIEHEQKRAAEKVVVDALLEKGDFTDDHGYPTDDALTIVELWPWEDEKGWFIFIESIWYMKSWGWNEGWTLHDWDNTKEVYIYEISTAGWSGNESVIRSMEKNDMLWSTTWVQSRRGGHFIFELRDAIRNINDGQEAGKEV